MRKPKITDIKYRWTILYHVSILYILFILFDFRDIGEWVLWNLNRLIFFFGAYMLFAFIQFRWDLYVYNHPEKFPSKKLKYSNKTYAEHQANRESISKDA